ncbi:MAG: histidinol-phosphate transaminase [Burkholderiales bacterium]|nr:histidinol-phosphate transaminase [Burkholderiales bacterium]
MKRSESPSPQSVIREDIRALAAYTVHPAQGMVKLDAMENPYGLPGWLREELARAVAGAQINRYPDPEAPALKALLRRTMDLPQGFDILLGNGSDEIIAMVISAVARPGAVVMAPTPAFAMYRMSAILAKAEFVGVPLAPDFSLDAQSMLAAMQERRPGVVFVAYPNNPTGNLFDEAAVCRVIEAAPGLVVLDEAYHVFAGRSFMSRLREYPNLLVLRTLSKLGLAGLRLGYAVAQSDWIREIDKVRGPYNVGVLTQAVAQAILEHAQVLQEQAAAIRVERERLFAELRRLPGVEVFPSEANFLLLRVPDAEAAFQGLLARGVLVRNLHGSHPLLDQCLRFTVGTPSENALLLAAFCEVRAG